MKMFLTRLGFGSRMVVTGDVTQVDLPAGQASGLRLVQEILEGVEDIQFTRLTSQDVVRHRLVGDIVNAYAAYEARTGGVAGPVRDGGLRGRAAERGDGRAGSRGPRKRAH
jgi:phosphate starvation-inducible PhoH-like protein